MKIHGSIQFCRLFVILNQANMSLVNICIWIPYRNHKQQSFLQNKITNSQYKLRLWALVYAWRYDDDMRYNIGYIRIKRFSICFVLLYTHFLRLCCVYTFTFYRYYGEKKYKNTWSAFQWGMLAYIWMQATLSVRFWLICRETVIFYSKSCQFYL